MLIIYQCSLSDCVSGFTTYCCGWTCFLNLWRRRLSVSPQLLRLEHLLSAETCVCVLHFTSLHINSCSNSVTLWEPVQLTLEQPLTLTQSLCQSLSICCHRCVLCSDLDLMEFSEPGIFNYSTLLLSEKRDALYVGAREAIFELSKKNVTVRNNKVSKCKTVLARNRWKENPQQNGDNENVSIPGSVESCRNSHADVHS